MSRRFCALVAPLFLFVGIESSFADEFTLQQRFQFQNTNGLIELLEGYTGSTGATTGERVAIASQNGIPFWTFDIETVPSGIVCTSQPAVQYKLRGTNTVFVQRENCFPAAGQLLVSGTGGQTYWIQQNYP